MAANVTTMQGRTLHIVLFGDVDWAWNSTTEIASVPQLSQLSALGRIFIDSITFRPSATADKVTIRECSLTGPTIFHRISADVYDYEPKYFGGKSFEGLFIAAADTTSNDNTAYVEIILA